MVSSLRGVTPTDGGRMLGDVRQGLLAKRKSLPPTYFYDARGSALFEQITRLPEYYLTRVERALLERDAAGIARTTSCSCLAELGAGTAQKSRILIRALRDLTACNTYLPVDVDAYTISATAAKLREEFPGLRVIPIVADMRDAVTFPAAAPRPLLCAFLGSSIGNFAPVEARRLLAGLRGQIGNDGRLLLGADLVKDPLVLERAYNDAPGLTAEFNRNVLAVLNRELGADFDAALFEHRAFYEQDHRRIEMHLVSKCQQRVTIPMIGEIDLAEGESIRTEISCKYDRESMSALLLEAGFAVERWIEDPDRNFALVLAQPAG